MASAHSFVSIDPYPQSLLIDILIPIPFTAVAVAVAAASKQATAAGSFGSEYLWQQVASEQPWHQAAQPAGASASKQPRAPSASSSSEQFLLQQQQQRAAVTASSSGEQRQQPHFPASTYPGLFLSSHLSSHPLLFLLCALPLLSLFI
jgi:hypothetical protein